MNEMGARGQIKRAGLCSDVFVSWITETLFTLTVVNGVGSGRYAEGTAVDISANDPPEGKVFDQWTGDTAHAADLNSLHTTVAMPPAEVTVTATYKDEPGDQLTPDIKVNGSDGPVAAPEGDPVSVTISLETGEFEGYTADWWIAIHTPFAPPGDRYTCVHATGWRTGVNLCTQAALFDLAPFEVLNMALPVGSYTFYFAVDPPDGVPTAELVDSVAVEVIP
jgi:hypothetical protein